ncbi:unnamed protein product [Kluyveromyces dobzhanskii CBS 2104]|uniref:Vacuolar ATPase assembly protein VMA22 n=1 Tax=Kluyveromyces dobzhanskii CBS 2104 TaxID=1427455 RepID=A0A0A8L2K4_9SACH|nr:unnamed protein product [Kluyveromyces dobzhanskii CBS 2104]
MIEDEIYDAIVTKLAVYDSLLEQLQSSFQEGFHNLSRANYHNKDALRGSYGKDYWDENYTGYRYVRIDDEHSVSEVEEKIAVGSDEETIPERISESNNEKVKKRKQREKLLAKVKKDPLYMFGGALSTPMSLKQCQSSFKASMSVMYHLIELRCAINNLLKKLEI